MEPFEDGETVHTEKSEAAKAAEAEGNIKTARFFERASKDEERHRAGHEGLIMRFKAHGWRISNRYIIEKPR